MESLTLQQGGSIIGSGDAVGQIQFAAPSESDAGASRYIVGQIYAQAEGAFNSVSNPASLVFSTSAADNLPASGKLKVSHEGHFLPLQDNTYDLGAPDLRFRHLYAADAVISPTGELSYLYFDTTVGDVDQVAGQLNWNSEAGTLDLGLTDDLTIHLGQSVLFRVKNSTGSTITKGEAVYASGVLGGGQIIQAAPFAADNSVDEVRFIGLVTDTISDGNDGFVSHFGHIKNVDLRTSNTALNPNGETWAVGDILFVDDSTPGGLTKVPPQDDIYVAMVLDDGQNGELFVRITDPGHMTDLHDVNFSGLVDNNLMVWNSGSDYWEPSSGLYYVDGDLGIGNSSPNATLHVYSPTPSGTIFNAEGTQGSLFSVVDNLSGTLMSVNTIAGLPVLEVNSDYSVTAGRFNQNDFVITSSGDIGIGTANPTEKLDIRYPVGGGMALLKSTDITDGLLFGDMAYSTNNSYQGIKHVGMTGTLDYMIMSEGVNTYISSKAGGITVIGAGGNDTNSQIQLKPNSEVVVNENSSNIDFRVESNNNTHMLFIDGITDTVGIGNSTPLYQLDVVGTGNFSGDVYVSGNVGVGTNSPNAVLHAYGSTPSGTVFNVEGTNGSLFSVVDNLSGVLMSVNNNAGLPVFEVYDDDSIVAGRFAQNDFVITSSGDIGMGTASPNGSLHVDKSISGGNNIYFRNTNNGSSSYQSLRLGNDTALTKFIIFTNSSTRTSDGGAGNTTIRTDSGNLILGSNGSEKIKLTSTEVVVNDNSSNFDFRVESDGNANMLFVDGVSNKVGIGTGSPNEQLSIAYTDASSGKIEFRSTSYARQAMIEGIDGQSSGDGHLAFHTRKIGNALERLRITADGNVGIGVTSPTSKLHVAGDGNVTGNVIVGGNLTILGTTVTADVDRMEVEDPIITLGLASGNIVTDTNLDRGLALALSTGLTAFIGWDASENEFSLLSSGIAQNSSGNYVPGTYGDLHIGELRAATANFSSTIDAANIGAGVDNSVVILDSDGKLRTDEIDSRVWGTSLVDGGGVAGHVAFWTDNNTLSYDSNQLFWDSTNNRLGIGTSNPTADIQIGNIEANAPSRKLIITGYSSSSLDFNNHNGWSLHRFVSDINGGMYYYNDGTNNTTTKFNIGKVTRTNGELRIFNSSSSNIQMGQNDSYPVGYIGTKNEDYNYRGGLVFTTRESTTITNQVYIDRYGHLGIGNGTNSPSTELDVSGVITANGGNSNEWNEAYDWIQNSGLDGTGAASGVAFWTDSNTLSYDSGLIWDSTNNRLGIGTTAPTTKALVINGENQYAGLEIYKSGTGNKVIGLGTGASNPLYDHGILQLYDSSTEHIRLYTMGNSWINGGNLGVGTNSPTQKLDVRYPAGGGMALLKSTDTTDGLLFGDMAYSTSNGYQGMKHAAMTNANDYMILSQGTNTYISAGTGGSVIMNAGGNDGDSSLKLTSTEVVINDQGSSRDFRVESNNNANMLFVDGVSDMVGIGTGSPAQVLHVYGGTISSERSATAGSPPSTYLSDITTAPASGIGSFHSHRFNTASTPDFAGKYGILQTSSSANDRQFQVYVVDSVTPKMVVNGNGNVGIGTASPSNKLHVQGSSDQLRLSDGTLAFTVGYDNNYLRFKNSAGDTHAVINWSSGNVGIGTTSPLAKLHIQGSSYQQGLLIERTDTSSKWGLAGLSSGGFQIWDDNQGNATRFVINSSGDVGIGVDSPTTKLDVAGSGNFSGDVTIDGHLSAATKSFYIDHPTKEGKLQYGSLESPYHGIRLTGKGEIKGGKCVVELPDYVNALVHDDNNVNIQITNYKHSKTLYVNDININDNQFTVKYDGWFGGNGLEFFWSFTAVRKDVQELKVEC